MYVGQARQFGIAGIQHDQPGSGQDSLLDAGAEDGVCLGRVGADDHQHIRLVDFLKAVGAGAGTQSRAQGVG